MSKEISSTPDEDKAQTEEENTSNNTPNEKKETKDTLQTLETETIPKTPISSATTFEELHEKESKNPSVFVNKSFENTEPTEGYNETECVKFAEKLHKIVEELRIGRVSDKENELRIQRLMSEKNDLERIKDDETLKNQELIKKHSMQQDESRKQFDDRLRSFQEDKTKHMLERQSGEQEIKALKDEIRSLHINKYSMEKMIKDQERQIQNHGTSNTNYLTQLAKVENQCKDIFKQCSQVLATVDKVEANINSSTKLNKKLGFMNEHQKCILVTYREKYEKTKQDLISLQACKVSSSVENSDVTKESTVHLEDELRMQKELCQQVQVQLNDSRQEIQGLLKSLDNAHSLLTKHVDTNNKYAESETMLQVELDDLRTDCEKYNEELKTKKASAQEKEVLIKELKNKMEEKEKQLNKQIEKFQKENETLTRNKTSLEELNSTWSQKIVEQKEEIESMRKMMSEMETSMEEGKQQLEVKISEVETLEEKLKTEASRSENLLQKADEEKIKNRNEANKWRERTTQLLQNEEKLKAELDKVQKENRTKEPQNQKTQTEVIEKANKETNTDKLSNEMSSVSLDKVSGTIQNIASEIHRNDVETMMVSRSKDIILQPKSPTKYNTPKQSKLDNTLASDTSMDQEPSFEANEATNKSAKVNNIETQQSGISKPRVFNNLEQGNTSIITPSDEPQLLQKTRTTFDKPYVHESTVNDQHRLETQNSKKKTIEKYPPEDKNVPMLTNTQPPTTVHTMTQPVSLLRERDTVITPQQPNDVSQRQNTAVALNIPTNQSKNPTLQSKSTAVQSGTMPNEPLLKQNSISKQVTGFSRNSPDQNINPAPLNTPTNQSKNPTLQSKNTAAQGENKTMSNESPLKQNNISTKQATGISRNSQGQNINPALNITTNQTANPTVQSKNTAVHGTMPNGSLSKQNNNSVPHQNHESPSQNRSTPSQQSISESNRLCARKTDNILGKKPTEKRTLAVVKPSAASTLMQSADNNSPIINRQPRRSEAFNMTIDTNLTSKVSADAVLSRVFNSKPRKSEPKSVNNLSNVNPIRNSDLASSFNNSQTGTKIMSMANTKDRQNLQRIKPMEATVFTTKTGQGFASNEEIIKPVTKTKVLESRSTKLADPNQTRLSEKSLKESDSLPEKSNLEQTSNKKDERKEALISYNEDFCFSDEDDETIPRAIGSQVDRIETFLKNERLRLSKKRKAMDD